MSRILRANETVLGDLVQHPPVCIRRVMPFPPLSRCILCHPARIQLINQMVRS